MRTNSISGGIFSAVITALLYLFLASCGKPVSSETALNKILVNSELQGKIADVQRIGEFREASFVFKVEFTDDASRSYFHQTRFSNEVDFAESSRIFRNARLYGLEKHLRLEDVRVAKGLDVSGLWMEVVESEKNAIVFAHRM